MFVLDSNKIKPNTGRKAAKMFGGFGLSAKILEGKCALVSLVALMLLPACAGPNVVDGPVPPEPNSSTIETESSMLVDDEAIETIAKIIWSEFDMDLSRIRVRYKWDSDDDAWGN